MRSRWSFDTDELYVKTPEEMAAAFGADSEQFRNTMEIARRVDFEFEFGKFHFPIYQDAQPDDLDQVLETRVTRGDSGCGSPKFAIARRGEFDEAPYYDRLDAELPVIREMGFSGYMLIVADFIDYARSQGIPVGPGRGSVVGSLVSYALRITEVDPIEHQVAVRAMAQSGTQIDARYRRRFLLASGATKCSTTCARSMATTASRKSSLSAPSRASRPFATSAACSDCHLPRPTESSSSTPRPSRAAIFR